MSDSSPRGIEFNTPQYLIAANTLVEAGDMVGLKLGYMVPVTHTTGIKVKGIATKTVDNRTTNTVGNSGLDGGAPVAVELTYCNKGLRTYKVFSDTAGNAITQADVGTAVYGLDSKTVTKASSGNSLACEVFRIDPIDGRPWVLFNQ
jgi:hypothetical protein